MGEKTKVTGQQFVLCSALRPTNDEGTRGMVLSQEEPTSVWREETDHS